MKLPKPYYNSLTSLLLPASNFCPKQQNISTKLDFQTLSLMVTSASLNLTLAR